MAGEFKHVSVGADLSQAEWESTAGHVLNSQATGDLIYASSASQLTRLGIGSTGNVLTVSGGIPAWGSASTVDVQTFTGNGTWTKPSGATANSRTLVKVFGAGGGGGGGGSNTGYNATGGGGGGGGAYSSFEFPTSSLGSTETVTIGSAGTAGTGGSTNGSDGTAGGGGGNTTFGSWLTGYGGGGGGKGQANANTKGATAGGGGGGGSTAGSTGSFYSSASYTNLSTAGGNPKTAAFGIDGSTNITNFSVIPGDAGGGWSVQRSPIQTIGSGVTTVIDQIGNGLNAGWFGGGGGGMCEIAEGSAYQGGPSMWGGGGGGGGGGHTAANTAFTAGKGGEYRKWYSMGYSSSGAAAGSTGSVSVAGGAGTAGTTGATNYTGGGGGGGGGTGSTGGAGGAGGARGGGGGGGGSSYTSTAGAGGAGGAGYCEVITYI